MEAPEKIYVHEASAPELTENLPYHIKYTRTDAIMKKVLEWLRKGGERGDAYIVTEFGEEIIDFVKLAEDLKNYMKGE